MTETELPSADHADEWSKLAQSKAFLGREFLTWLWYLADLEKHTAVQLEGKRKKTDVELWVDDRILLESEDGSREESLIRYGDPGSSTEATAALKNGKTVKEMKLGVRIKEVGEFTANLSHDQLSPRSMQLPGQTNEDLGESQTLEKRIELTNLFLRVLDALFLNFLSERTDPEWQDEGLEKSAAGLEQEPVKLATNEVHCIESS